MIYTHLELLFVVAIWAGTFVATKIVVAQIPPALSALYRYLIASIILLGLNYKKLVKVEKRDYPSFFYLGLTGITLYYLLQHYGIKYTNAIDASILISLSPVFIALISWILLKEPVKPLSILGLFLSLVGSVIVITNGKISWGESNGRMWGNILILCTAISWAVYSVYGKKLLSRYKPEILITYTTLIGTLLLVPFSIFELLYTNNFSPNWIGWLNLLYLGGAASVYGYLAWYRALTELSAVTVGSYLYFRPLLTGLIAAVILNERVGAMVVLGGILIIGGTYLTARN